MQAIEEQVRPEFKGSKKNKELASRVFDVTAATARFFSHSAPIRVSLDSLAQYFAEADGDDADKLGSTIDKALSGNEHVFLRQETEEGIVFLTTRSGLSPVPEVEEDTSHSLAARLTEPPPVPEVTTPRRRPQKPIEPEPYPADYPELSAVDSGTDVTEEVHPAAETTTPSREAAEAPVEQVSDIADATDAEIAEALRHQLAYDYAVANFGDWWMVEEKVPRLSRGDLRRIKDYIAEQGVPVSDEQIVQDLLGIRQSAQEYELHRFAVNFRLSRETRDYEFVGIPGAHFWTTAGIETPTVAKRRASEVGQDYRVLLDLTPTDLAEEGVIEHVLTFYEHRHGVLPLDAAFAAIIKGPVLPGQRSAIVQFESPLTNEKFPIEARYPTGNRGGFLAGFAEFFQEHLVPGAFLTIEATDEPGNYTIEFLTVSGQDRKLLVLDEKRNEYKFESVTFYCAPNEDMLLAENRFPKLAGTGPLDERSRRQPELVIAKAFEHVGERVDADGDGQLMAVMDELVGAANIERPVPAELIRAIAESDDRPQFSIDPEADDVIYYRPGSNADTAS
jgi:hypothetical protein